MQKQISEHAAAAKAIRAELKAAFLTVKFSVRSESFSMGDAVRISWTDGPTSKEVEGIVKKYQYGNFNSMEDYYECSNRIEGLPQTKYVTTSREASEEIKYKIAVEIGHRDGQYFSQDIYREFYKRSFV